MTARPVRQLRPSTAILTVLALVLGFGWLAREVAFARAHAATVAAQTVTLDRVAMKPVEDQGKAVGQIGIYVNGDTPASSKFVTGRFIIAPGQTPHKPHTHVEEEVMVIESGHGEIFCDGKTTAIGPGSVMYTTPMASHGIVNTGKDPLTFYFVKWAPRDVH
jgi:mannose-6-phosphate isomerase-like protein (cupin superfamily)